MRLWHKNLIKVLPRQQLVGQWRELSAIAGNIKSKGTPNHILVNKIMEYSLDHFITYSKLVFQEMQNRGYRPSLKVWNKIESLKPDWEYVFNIDLYNGWHNNRYCKQCYYNLEEKFDCGGIQKDTFEKITIRVEAITRTY